MNKAMFFILRYTLTAIALLPMQVLYLCADVLFFIIYHLVRYRRALVRRNLSSSFPDKDPAWLHKTERQFYRNFADYIVETLKLLHISDKEIDRRMSFENLEIIDSLVADGHSVVIYFSHCFNWEWAPAMTHHVRQSPSDAMVYGQVYRPLRNHAFDALMLLVRSRFGSRSFSKKTVLRHLIELHKAGAVSITGFMSDQKPSHGDAAVPMMFLNHPTAFISGTETLARKLKMAAVYWDTDKPSRGHYRLTCRLMCDDASTMPQHELTRLYGTLLQGTIERNPSIWLWTHNRWKNPVPDNVSQS